MFVTFPFKDFCGCIGLNRLNFRNGMKKNLTLCGVFNSLVLLLFWLETSRGIDCYNRSEILFFAPTKIATTYRTLEM